MVVKGWRWGMGEKLPWGLGFSETGSPAGRYARSKSATSGMKGCWLKNAGGGGGQILRSGGNEKYAK